MTPAAAMPGPAPVTYTATIEAIDEIAPQTRSFRLRLPAGSPFRFTPGQFISCRLPAGPTPLTRPYSLASDPEALPALEICLNRVPEGPGSAYLFSLDPGASLAFTGPWGTFRLDTAPAVETVFLAEGPGIVPIRPMIRRALRTGTAPLRLIYAAPSRSLLLYDAEFTAAAGDRLAYTPLVGPSLEAVVEAEFIADDPPRRDRCFFICAVGDIVTRLRDRLRAAGYERRAVQYEKW